MFLRNEEVIVVIISLFCVWIFNAFKAIETKRSEEMMSNELYYFSDNLVPYVCSYVLNRRKNTNFLEIAFPMHHVENIGTQTVIYIKLVIFSSFKFWVILYKINDNNR